MKKLFVWMAALNVAALVLIVSGSMWYTKTCRDRAEAFNKRLDAKERRIGLELDMKSVDKVEAGDSMDNMVSEHHVYTPTSYWKVERGDDGPVVLRPSYDDSGKSVCEKLPLGRYKEQIQKRIAEQDAIIKSAGADRMIANFAGALAIIVKAIGLGSGLIAFGLFVLFVLVLLDRLDALACLPQMLKNETAMSAKLMSVEQYMTALAANSSEINRNVAKLDKHVCTGINWFGEMLAGGVTKNAKPA